MQSGREGRSPVGCRALDEPRWSDRLRACPGYRIPEDRDYPVNTLGLVFRGAALLAAVVPDIGVFAGPFEQARRVRLTLRAGSDWHLRPGDVECNLRRHSFKAHHADQRKEPRPRLRVRHAEHQSTQRISPDGAYRPGSRAWPSRPQSPRRVEGTPESGALEQAEAAGGSPRQTFLITASEPSQLAQTLSSQRGGPTPGPPTGPPCYSTRPWQRAELALVERQ